MAKCVSISVGVVFRFFAVRDVRVLLANVCELSPSM